MSFNPKNLAYELKEPSFLRKLRSQHGGSDSSRHERVVPRPRRDRDVDEDDGPTYVDEASNDTLSKVEYEALIVTSGEKTSASAGVQAKGDEAKEVLDTEGKDPEQRANATEHKEIIAGIGERKKRKPGKVVGGTSRDKSDEIDDLQKSHAKSVSKTKKTKRVKLSFQDDQEDG